MIISEKTFEKARKKIAQTLRNKGYTEQCESTEQPIIFTSDDDELNRKILEKEKINILLLNQKNRKDFQKQRNSGFNQVLAKEAKKKNVTIGINLDEIIESIEKSKILARIKQNVKLCNKNKLKMKFISEKYKRNFQDLKALGLTLGMSTNMLVQ